jgi:DNA-binding MarR family transcriptional regulator
MKYDLELRDVRVFYALRKAGGTKDARDIADYTGIPQAMVFLSLQKLAMRGLAKVRFDLSKAELEITDDSKALCDELDVAVHDLENACTKGFSEEEIKLMKQFEARVSKNLKDDIQTI